MNDPVGTMDAPGGAMSGAVSDLEEELYCPICADLYSQPLMLPCTHSFCHACLQERIQKGQVTRHKGALIFDCPVCRKDVTLDDAGLEGLPSNRLLRRIVERHKLSLSGSGTLSSSLRRDEGDVCADHDKQLGAFCGVCREAVCIDCIVNDHRGHAFESLEDIYFKQKKKLAKRISGLEEETRALDSAEADEKTYLDQMQQHFQQKAEAIEVQFDEYIGLIKQSKDSVLKELVARQQEEVAKVTRALDAIETKRTRITTVLKALNDSVSQSRMSLLKELKTDDLSSTSGPSGSQDQDPEYMKSPRTRCFLECSLHVDSASLETAINNAHLVWEPEIDLFSPKHLADQFTKLYEKEWKSAYLESSNKNKDEVVAKLLSVVMDAVRQAEQCSESHLEGMTYHMLQPDIDVAVGAYNIHGFNNKENDGDESAEFCSMKEGLRKLRALHSTDFYKENLAFMIHHEMAQVSQGNQRQQSLYTNKCFEVCFVLQIQDPPLHVCMPESSEPGADPDRELYKYVKRRGRKTKTIAWPPLFLYKDGPLLAKGIVFIPG